MPKIRNMSLRGLVQESGTGVTFEQGQITRRTDFVTATVDTANGDTTTDLGISLPSGCRILQFKIEVLSSANTPSGNITQLGFKGGDTDAIFLGTLAAATAGGEEIGYSNTLGVSNTANATPTTELMLTHADPGGAGKTSKVRVTVLFEVYS